METKNLESELKKIAKTRVNQDVIVLYMMSKKYKIDLLSLLILYEVYEKDIFLFFYIMSGKSGDTLLGKSTSDINLDDELLEFPKESNLKLMFSKAKKISDALRRNSSFGLTSVTLPWYESLKEHCEKSLSSGENYIDFYTILEKDKEEEKAKTKPTKHKKEEAVAV